MQPAGRRGRTAAERYPLRSPPPGCPVHVAAATSRGLSPLERRQWIAPLPETPCDDALMLILRLRTETAFRLGRYEDVRTIAVASGTDTNILKTCSKDRPMTPLRELYDLYYYSTPAKEERQHELLMKIPIDARDKNNYGHTSLHIAAEFTDFEAIVSLLPQDQKIKWVKYFKTYRTWQMRR